jgi:hypothetical protein
MEPPNTVVKKERVSILNGLLKKRMGEHLEWLAEKLVRPNKSKRGD